MRMNTYMCQLVMRDYSFDASILTANASSVTMSRSATAWRGSSLGAFPSMCPTIRGLFDR